MMIKLKFHNEFIVWIMLCVSFVKFKVSIENDVYSVRSAYLIIMHGFTDHMSYHVTDD